MIYYTIYNLKYEYLNRRVLPVPDHREDGGDPPGPAGVASGDHLETPRTRPRHPPQPRAW